MKPKSTASGAAPVVTMAWVEECTWDLTAETPRDWKVVGDETWATDATPNVSIVNSAGASTFEVNATHGIQITRSTGGGPYILLQDLGAWVDLGTGPAHDVLDRIFVAVHLDQFSLPTNADQITVGFPFANSGTGEVQMHLRNASGTVSVRAGVYDALGSRVTGDTATVLTSIWFAFEIAGGSVRMGYAATQPDSIADCTAMHEGDHEVVCNATNDAFNPLRGYVQVVGASGAAVAVDTIAFSRRRGQVA